MEYLAENLAWLDDQLQDFDDDYLLIDCPGQVELYTHLPAMRQIVDHLQGAGYRVCAVFLLDGVFVNDTTRLIAGTLMCLSAMVQL
jgi:GTPase SAR1 family protein